MISFKYINKEKIKKIGSAILLTTMIGSTSIALTSCGSDDKEVVVVNDRKNYGVFIENDIACIYELTSYVRDSANARYYSETDSVKKVILQGDMVHYLENYTLEEAEEYAKNLLTENGVIRYYNVEGKENPKALKKTK